MRDGKVVGDLKIADTNKNEIISLMTGKILKHKERHTTDASALKNKPLLEVENMTDRKMLDDVSFKVLEGEVLGIGGLIGAQRTELMRLISGVDKAQRGSVKIGGKVVNISSPVSATRDKIGYLSENRKEEGLNLGLTVSENIILSNFKAISPRGIVNSKKVRELGEQYVNDLRIKGRPNSVVGNLSGGNQQKVAIAKWLFAGCRVLIFDEPTRGIDVAAKAEIYEMIRQFARNGNAAIVVSSEVNELVDVCDRILVMSRGEIIAEINGADINQDKVLHAITSSGGKQI